MMRISCYSCLFVTVLGGSLASTFTHDGLLGSAEQQTSAFETIDLVQEERLFDLGACCYRDGTCIQKTEVACYAPNPGDLNADYFVDAVDYVIIRDAFGSSSGMPMYVPAADFDMDGTITLVDYQAWLLCYAAGPRCGLCFEAGAACADADADRIPDCLEKNNGVRNWPCRPGTDPAKADTDGDGIKDGDEWWGTAAGLDLHGLGADPCKKDIFLEIDWVTDDDSTPANRDKHKPCANQITRMVNAFEDSPVQNPYTVANGVVLHVDVSNYAGKDAIVNIQDWGINDEFNLIKTGDGTPAHPRNFAENRNGYFHYCLSLHDFSFRGTTQTYSGLAELPGDDLICAWNPIRNVLGFNGTGSHDHQIVGNTIMHELGHNLELCHGGDENEPHNKPNYVSIMNYRYQFVGCDDNWDALGNGVLDYSWGLCNQLDETNLDERIGIAGFPINWNRDNDATDVAVARNITCDVDNGVLNTEPCDGAAQQNPSCTTDDNCTVLHDFYDWTHLTYTGITDGDKVGIEIQVCWVPEHLLPTAEPNHQIEAKQPGVAAE